MRSNRQLTAQRYSGIQTVRANGTQLFDAVFQLFPAAAAKRLAKWARSIATWMCAHETPAMPALALASPGAAVSGIPGHFTDAVKVPRTAGGEVSGLGNCPAGRAAWIPG
jgi:hypothetical protein